MMLVVNSFVGVLSNSNHSLRHSYRIIPFYIVMQAIIQHCIFKINYYVATVYLVQLAICHEKQQLRTNVHKLLHKSPRFANYI